MKNLMLIFLIITFSNCEKELVLENSCVEPCAQGEPLIDTAVILVLGQSNAANLGGKLYGSIYSNTHNYYLGNYYKLSDPLKGANGNGGSVWSRLADLLVEESFAKQIIIAPAAQGGTKVEQWIPGGDMHSLIVDQVEALQADKLKITHILWHQGESNNTVLNPSMSPAQNAQNYSVNFLKLVEYFRSNNVDAPIYLAVTSLCGTLPIDYDLQLAQINLANDSLGIFNGPNTDLLDMSYRRDDCHFNAKGLNMHASMWRDVLID